MSNTVKKYRGRITDDGMFTVGYVAYAFNVAPRTVQKWMEDGLLKCAYRLPKLGAYINKPNIKGGERRFTLKDIVQFAKEQSVPLPDCFKAMIERPSIVLFNVNETVRNRCNGLPNLISSLNSFEFARVCLTGLPNGISHAIIGDTDGQVTAFQAVALLYERHTAAKVHLLLNDSNYDELVTLYNLFPRMKSYQLIIHDDSPNVDHLRTQILLEYQYLTESKYDPETFHHTNGKTGATNL